MQVSAGQALIVVDAEEGEGSSTGESTLFEGLNGGSAMDRLFEENGAANMLLLDSMSEAEAGEVVEDILRTLRNVMLGYDVSPGLMKKLFLLFKEDGKFPRMEHPERLMPLAEVLQSFVAVESLFDRNLLPLEEQPAAVSAQIAFYEFCRNHRLGEEAVPKPIESALRSALALYKVTSLEPTDELREALWRLAVAHGHPVARHQICSAVMRGMIALNQVQVSFEAVDELPATLERVARLARKEHRAVSDTARQASYELFRRNQFVQRDQTIIQRIDAALQFLSTAQRAEEDAQRHLTTLLTARQTLMPFLAERTRSSAVGAELALEVLVKRFYQQMNRVPASEIRRNGTLLLQEPGAESEVETLLAMSSSLEALEQGLEDAFNAIGGSSKATALEVILWDTDLGDETHERVTRYLSSSSLASCPGLRVTVTWNRREIRPLTGLSARAEPVWRR